MSLPPGRIALESLASRRFDVIVIGGGINGAGIALEARRAGYETLLVERDDFGAGTTSRATRLIHGGLRYLEHGEIALVYESLGERAALVREAPHLVSPLQLLVPVYEGDARPGWMIRAGLLLYDLLSIRKPLPRHRAMPERALASYEPGLARDGLRAAFLMSDAQIEFPERIVAETVRVFTEAGGVALNHAAVTAIVSPAHRLRALRLRDALSGAEAEVETSVAVNAAGPWVDAVLAGSDAERHDRLVGGTKGSHLVVDWRGGPTHPIFASARADGRPFFILPWYRYTLIGTTDLRFEGDPSDARCTADEMQYLLDEASRLFPATPLTRRHVLYTYSGIRPLPWTPAGDESTITRSHFLVDHEKRGGPAGLLSVVGGKLTTYRSLARTAIPAIARHCKPAGPPIPAPPVPRPARGAPSSREDPLALYGAARGEIEALIAADPALGDRLCPHNPDLLAQVAWAVERELAVTLGDVLLRRMPVGWSACHARDGAAAALAVMAPRLGWSGQRIAAEIAAYEAEVARVCVRL